MQEKSASKHPAPHQGARADPGARTAGDTASPARLPFRGEDVHLPESAARASDPYAGLTTPRHPERRKLPKLESECKAGVTPQSKGQAGSCFIRAQDGSDRLVGSGHFCLCHRQQTGDL